MRSGVVLYAEDDENDAFFMQRAFTKLNRTHELRIVNNGRVAIDYLAGTGEFAERARHPLPALLLLDVKMPDMSGLEVLAWVRARREFDALPVVMFTSSTQELDVSTSRRGGANAYLVKPSNASDLSQLMHQVLAASAGLSAPGARLAIEANQL